MNIIRRYQPNVLTRRAVLAAGASALTGSLVGCDAAYVAEVLAIAVADLVGVYFTGVPIGTLAAGAIEGGMIAAGTSATGDAKNSDGTSASGPPPSVGLKYHDSTTQEGFDFQSLPVNTDAIGAIISASTDGHQGISVFNDKNEIITLVKLVDDTGILHEVNGAKNGWLQRDKLWEVNHDLHILGLDTKNYVKLFYQTESRKTGTIPLVG